MSTRERPAHITIDLDRLGDTSYMEVMTGTAAWAELESYFRDAMTVSLIEQIRASALSEETKRQVVQEFLRGLSEEERARISSMLRVSDLLDTLIDVKN